MSLTANIAGLRLSMNDFMDNNLSAYQIIYDENFANPDTFSAGAKWITPIYGSGDIAPTNPVKEIEFFIYCFSKGDAEGLELAEMIDAVCNSFSDQNNTDGKKRIPFYVVDNGVRVQVSTIMASDIFIERGYRLGDSTSAQAVRTVLKWC